MSSTVPQVRNDSVTESDRESQPWKYIGYCGFCRFIASDDDFFIFRKFSNLTARVLLALQDELSELESQLQQIDTQLSLVSAANVHNGSFRQESSQPRLDLIREIDLKLRAYNELINQHSQIRGRPQVPERDRNSLSNWFSNNEAAILAEETDYVKHSEDLFAIVPKSKTPLRSLLERSSHFRLFRLWLKPIKERDENIHYTSDERIDMFISVIIASIGLAMLIAPLWSLAFVTWVVYRLAIITCFVVLFLCFVTFTTVARPFETLGAAAA